ncbi:MAG: ABC transporter ATP-binding protein, partial [Actinomycetota bacterium]
MSLDASIDCQVGSLHLDVSFQIAPGEVLALLGPNGAGKSTILRVLAGLRPLDGGRITIDGTAVDDPALDVFVPADERPVGFVFQDYLLFDHLSVLENVAFGLRARQIAKNPARTLARQWLERLGLADLADRRPATLSGGQAQRVAVARAVATSPRLLLLNEPLAALDVGTRAQVRRDLKTFLDSYEGMRLLVTHDPVDAHALADVVVIIEDGRIVQSGSLEDIAARPRSRYVADLVGLNVVAGTVHDGILLTDEGARIVVADAVPGRALAMFHPRSITITRHSPQASSVRNDWPGTIVGIERIGDRARVQLRGPLVMAAEVT